MITIEGIELDKTNKEFNFASEFVLSTNKLVYLTGKAGTGKTTFLKYIKECSNKNMAILAPTGVAAINARGQTIHSFFKIKPSIYVPNDVRLRTKYNPDDSDKSTIYDNFQYNKNKLSIIKGLELLIIDEISMVRCDLLDVVDRLLRVFRKREHEAFGGVQVVLIGDTFQLPPIAQEPEWEILKQFYKNPFFFSAKVIEENKPVYIELKKIYRQKEQDFIDLLNRVRVNQITPNDINKLNAKFNSVFVPNKNENYITLATHNEIVKRTNLTKLEELHSELKLFEATVTGDFPEGNMPTDRILQLKENAQIMFVKNDKGKRYFNGKIAKVIKIDEDGIVAELSEDNQILVERETWDNIRYVWNNAKKRVEEEIIGTFTQYPIKLAWAITVHKSQGLTFEKVIADLNSAFAPGQVYVALSRCTTFNGLVLRTQLHPNAIKTAPEVLKFAQNEMPDTLIVNELNSGKADFYYKQVRENLAKSDFETAYNNLLKALKHRNDIETETFKRWFVAVGKRMDSYGEKYHFLKENYDKIIEKLNNEIEGLRIGIGCKERLIETQQSQIKELQEEIECLNKKIDSLPIETNNRKKMDEGNIGELTWVVYDDGTLVISGEGEMPECNVIYDDGNCFGVGIPWTPWFDYRESITAIVIESGVTTIKYYVFDECSPIVSIAIPKSVTSIENNIFDRCNNLTSINVESENPNYSSDKDVLFNKDKTILIYCPKGKAGDYVIPSGVTSIEKSAFSGCSSLTSITISSGVTTIGKWAFFDCNSLTSINVESENENYSSDKGVLFNKNKTILIYCPKGKAGDYVIPNGVTDIESDAFRQCSSLTSITISSGVTAIIEVPVFSGCSNLISINVESENANYSSDNGVLFSKNKTILIHCPSGKTGDYVIPNGVTSIGERAFSGCDNLASITLHSGVISIERFVFFGCSNLTSINVESGNANYSSDNGVLFNKDKTILIRCPKGKTGDYVIPSGVITIEDLAFFDCRKLTLVTIPNGVTKIGGSTFSGCSSLISIAIPSTVTTIEEFAFSGCCSLTSVAIPNGVTEIQRSAFFDCSCLISITIPDSVTTIGSSAFEGCSNLTSVTIPNGVTTIGTRAFFDCNSLTSITIPNSVNAIDDLDCPDYDDHSTLDLNCSNLTSIIVGSKNTNYSSDNGVLFNKDKTTLIYCPRGKTGDYVIPSGVRIIGMHAFTDCNALTLIVIPNSVKDFAPEIFEIGFEEGCKFVIRDTAFFTCNNLTSMIVESENTEYSSDNGVLFNKDKTTLLCCPKGKIGNYVIPNVVTTIKGYAFSKCSALTSITIPDSVTSIEKWAFSNCGSLTSIVIPNSVTSIGAWAFMNCTGLEHIYSHCVTPPKIDLSTFAGVDKNTRVLHVPAGSKNKYANAEEWKEFENIQEI